MSNYLDRLNDPFFVSCSMLGLISWFFMINHFISFVIVQFVNTNDEFGKTGDTVNRLKTSQ